jgi:hypothetical protein
MADTVVDTAQRLGDKMDWLSGSAASEGGQRRPQPPKQSSKGPLASQSWESGINIRGSMQGRTKVSGLAKDEACPGVETAADQYFHLEPSERRESHSRTAARRELEICKNDEEDSDSAKQGRPDNMLELAINTKSPDLKHAAESLTEMGTKIVAIDKRLEKISHVLGVKTGVNEGDDDEDRRRLKEKLKLAIEVDRRSQIRAIISRGEVWMEDIFGICSPDQRLGKRGSR